MKHNNTFLNMLALTVGLAFSTSSFIACNSTSIAELGAAQNTPDTLNALDISPLISETLAPGYSVSMPEETPGTNDVLYVDYIANNTIHLAYYEPQGKQKELFPDWRLADSIAGLDNRYSDTWCMLAAPADTSNYCWYE